jgi:NAD(P)-dependent dehydrogenase (short-subunit alcohol dehydrogenase family)
MPTSAQPLAGRVALVAGATRGCGRAIAIELGALGATVYGSGRSTRAGRSVLDRPETIEETAERVTAAGGEGIAVRCDHGDPTDVAAFVDRIRTVHGRLDVLVNDVWGGDHFVSWGKALWEHPLDATLTIVRNGLETHLITSHLAIPLLLQSADGLVVEVGDGKADAPYRTNLPYDLVKTSVVRLGEALAWELAPHGVTAVSVTPGYLRSEMMLELYGVTEQTWREAAARVDYFEHSETPHLLGRGVAALAADPGRARFAAQCLGSWELMRHYGFTDADGQRPNWGAVDREAREQALTGGHPAAES